VGEDDRIDKIKPSRQRLVKDSPDQGAAVGLQVRIGPVSAFVHAENPEGEGTRGKDHLFGRIGTKVSGNPAPRLSFKLPAICIGIGGNIPEKVYLCHQIVSIVFEKSL
jgi:hypothetical protein